MEWIVSICLCHVCQPPSTLPIPDGTNHSLCHVCEGKLQSVAKHGEQLGVLRAEIHTLLQSALHLNPQRELVGPKDVLKIA